MKILNLFAGIGGNRTLWGDEHEITAVECNSTIAAIYHQRFPNDIVVVGDAYKFLEDHYQEFDFVWISPLCPSHSKLRLMNQNKKMIPDMSLYGIIIFCQYFVPGKWVVENVQGYYKPLVRPTSNIGRHYWWTNFNIPEKLFSIPKEFIKYRKCSDGKTRKNGLREMSLEILLKYHKIDPKIIDGFPGNKIKILRNCVDYRIGKYILDCAIHPKQKTLF